MNERPPEYTGIPVSYRQIADWLEKVEGLRISKERIKQIDHNTLRKLEDLLRKDPYVRDWLEEKGLS